jgi:hypothetical protein
MSSKSDKKITPAAAHEITNELNFMHTHTLTE